MKYKLIIPIVIVLIITVGFFFVQMIQTDKMQAKEAQKEPVEAYESQENVGGEDNKSR